MLRLLTRRTRLWGATALATAYALCVLAPTIVFAFGDGLRGYDVDKQKDVIVDWTGIPDRMESRIVVMPQSR